MSETEADPRFAGPPAKADWMAHTSYKDWMFDGHPIRNDWQKQVFDQLDWTKAWVDMGPSPGGNPGPYWHVPRVGDEQTIHRLYPRLLLTKWLTVVRRAVEEMVAKPPIPTSETVRQDAEPAP